MRLSGVVEIYAVQKDTDRSKILYDFIDDKRKPVLILLFIIALESLDLNFLHSPAHYKISNSPLEYKKAQNQNGRSYNSKWCRGIISETTKSSKLSKTFKFSRSPQSILTLYLEKCEKILILIPNLCSVHLYL